MPRVARQIIPALVHHVIVRFVDRSWFFQTHQERETYLRMLGRSVERSDWSCIAYALMSNHIHLAMLAGYCAFESVFKPVHSPFARWMNHQHRRLGPVIAERPAAHAFLPHNVASLVAYIHNNPVRAGVVGHARESSWTSHRAYAGLVGAPTWLNVEMGLQCAGFDDKKSFDRWVDATPGERRDPELRTLKKEARKLGSIELATPVAQGDEYMVPLVARPYGHVRPDPKRVVTIASTVTNVPLLIMCSRRKLAPIVTARALAVRAGLAVGLTQRQLATAMGISDTGVQRLAHRALDADASRMLVTIFQHLEAESLGVREAG